MTEPAPTMGSSSAGRARVPRLLRRVRIRERAALAVVTLAMLGCGGTRGTTHELGRVDLRAGRAAVLPLSEVASTELSLALCFDGASLRRANFDPFRWDDAPDGEPGPFRVQVYFVLEDGSELGPATPAAYGADHCPQVWQARCGVFTCPARVRAVRVVSPADVRVDRVYFKTRTPA